MKGKKKWYLQIFHQHWFCGAQSQTFTFVSAYTGQTLVLLYKLEAGMKIQFEGLVAWSDYYDYYTIASWVNAGVNSQAHIMYVGQ